MPRSRRRHHSRSRTRSRSHSYDRDREPKRRKIEGFESPQHKRSLSPESKEENEVKIISDKQIETVDVDAGSTHPKDCSENKKSPKSPISTHSDQEPNETNTSSPMDKILDTSTADSESDESDVEETSNKNSDPNTSQDSANLSKDCSDSAIIEDEESKATKKSLASKVADSKITPRQTLSPKQLRKKLESEKRREEQRKEREKKKQELLKIKEEKLKKREEKLKEKQEQKQKEIEEKQKEKELKDEKKKKEREEKEQKRKEKDDQKRKELEEKQKQEEKKQKAAAAFTNFFTKKSENAPIKEKKADENISSSTFMPFELKSDMRLAPILRKTLTNDQKKNLTIALQKQIGKVYLEELKAGKEVGKSDKTWPPEDLGAQDDIVIVEDANPGESIEEQSKTNDKKRAKFLKFADNRRPAYFGTWRKKSKFVKPRKPLALDKEHFDYEYDSDEDWEEGEDTGESLRGSDDEDKENESDNEYEEDNEFFVPHGHLSDDEVNDEEDSVISPEAHKAKLKLLKKEFEEEMKGKTQKIKPRVIGCIWYNKDPNNVDIAIHEFLKPLSIISNGPVIIKKRSTLMIQQTPVRARKRGKPLGIELVPEFLKLIHGNTNNQKSIVIEFINHLNAKKINADVSKNSLSKQVKQFAEWMRCPEDGPLHNKFCWVVRSDVKKEYEVDLSIAKN